MENTVLDPSVDINIELESGDITHLVLEGFSGPTGEFKTAKEMGLPGGSVIDSFVFGSEIVALCGAKFIARKDPSKYPICPLCSDIAKQLGWKIPV